MNVPLKLQSKLALYEKAREEISAFRAANPLLVERWEQLLNAHNEALDDVKKLYRENADTVGDRLGDFSVRTRTSLNGSTLIEMMGDSALLLCSISYKVNRDAFYAAVHDGTVPEEVVDAVEEVSTPSIYGPKAL